MQFPDPLDYDVVVPLGARWAVYDEQLKQKWVADEMALVRAADAAGVGVLGVCFGGQLVAQAFGGTVQRSADPEIGWHQITTDAPDLIPGGPWFQWHFDRFDVPPGAVELARNGRAAQAFVIGHCVGLQFHPELDGPLLEAWLANDAAEAIALGVQPDELRSATANCSPTPRVACAPWCAASPSGWLVSRDPADAGAHPRGAAAGIDARAPAA